MFFLVCSSSWIEGLNESLSAVPVEDYEDRREEYPPFWPGVVSIYESLLQ